MDKATEVAARFAAMEHTEQVEHLPSSWRSMSLVHTSDYVAAVRSRKIHNGYGNRSAAIRNALPYQVGNIMAAARVAQALRRVSDAPVVASLSADFHQAGREYGGDGSTINGLMVLAGVYALKGARVSIIDFDMNAGHGTADIIERLPWLGSQVLHVGHGGRHESADWFVSSIGHRVYKRCLRRDLTIYQAGANMSIDDPDGGTLSDRQLAERDRSVFYWGRESGIPLVWTLSGGSVVDRFGSTDAVIRRHCETMRQCIDIYVHGGNRQLPRDWAPLP